MQIKHFPNILDIKMSFELCEFLPLLFLVIKSMFLFIPFPLNVLFVSGKEQKKKKKTPTKKRWPRKPP